jgi:hypothetical protein
MHGPLMSARYVCENASSSMAIVADVAWLANYVGVCSPRTRSKKQLLTLWCLVSCVVWFVSSRCLVARRTVSWTSIRMRFRNR